MTGCTIIAKIIFDVIGTLGIDKIGPMTVNTGDSCRRIPGVAFALMAGIAIDRSVNSHEWEGCLFVKLGDVFYDPRLWRMTSCTVITYGLLMDICVTGNTSTFSFFKLQCLMTRSAVQISMQAYKRERCTVVAEGHFILIICPIFRVMTSRAVDIEVRTMRRLGQDTLAYKIQQKQKT